MRRPIGRSRSIWLTLLCALAGCSGHKTVIYLDHEWSLYYAKNTCYLYLPKGDRDPGLDACLRRQVSGLENFERELLPGLTAHPACAGVVVAKITGDQAPPGTRFWRLLISLDDPEGKREPWDLMSPRSPPEIHHGAGDVGEIARGVCEIATGRAPRRNESSHPQ